MTKIIKSLITTLSAAALVMGCATTPTDGKVYRFKYESAVATFKPVAHIDIHDVPGNYYVEYTSPIGMEYCLRGKMPAKKEIVGAYFRFIFNENKPDCPLRAILVKNDGSKMTGEFNVSGTWVSSKTELTVR